jgi:GGDEF domain-containing protein
MSRLDTERNYPISILMGDVNGLKLANDVFGTTMATSCFKTWLRCLTAYVGPTISSPLGRR